MKKKINSEVYCVVKQFWKVLRFNHGQELATKVVRYMLDNDDFSILRELGIDVETEFELYNKVRFIVVHQHRYEANDIENDSFKFEDDQICQDDKTTKTLVRIYDYASSHFGQTVSNSSHVVRSIF